MPIRNPNFAEAGESPGVPRDWALVSFVRAERVAGFGPAPERGVEDFERWSRFVYTLEQSERAFFDARPEGFEDFSEGFGTDAFALRFEDARSERALFEGSRAEGFSHGFANDRFALRWQDVAATPAEFMGTAAERFEAGFGNDRFAWSLAQVTTAAARFTGRTAEAFETTWPEHDTRGGDSHG